MVRLLLEAGAEQDVMSPRITVFNSCTASWNLEDLEVMRLLLDTASAEDIASMLRIGAKYGKLEVVQLMLESFADKDSADENGRTALHAAASKGHLEVVQLLDAQES